MNKIMSYFKENYWALLGFLCNPIGTLIFVGTMVSLYETNVEFKLTIWGYIIAVIIAIIVLVKLNGKFKQMQHGVARGLLLSILPIVIWVGGFGLVWAMSNMADKAVTYWCICGAFFIASRFFYIMHEIKKSSMTNNQNQNNTTTIQITTNGEVKNGEQSTTK